MGRGWDKAKKEKNTTQKSIMMYFKYFMCYYSKSLSLIKGKIACIVWHNYIIEIAISQFVKKL